MFNNEIEFISHKDYVDLKEDQPIPIKLNIPEWYKNLKHGMARGEKLTVKGCMPFLDTLTTGYLLKVSQDIHISHNVYNEETKAQDSFYKVQDTFEQMFVARGLNFHKNEAAIHPTFQAEGSPYVEKNKNLPFYKILNPWIIKTPPGYSCLFLPPLNNSDDRFSIMPGIVDTDTFTQEVNFPIVINGDKYDSIVTTIKKGTPCAQVIPFKRESWKMKIVGKTSNEFNKKKLFYPFKLLHNYKERFWNKKSFK